MGIIRVSTEGQAGEDGEGLERQRHSVKGIAKALSADLQMVEVIGVSGSDLAETPAWNRVIAPAIKAGAHVAADAIDRIVRADGFDLTTLKVIKEAGARIYIPGTMYDPARVPRDVLSLTMFAGMGGAEKADIKWRLNGGKERGRAVGRWVSGKHILPMGVDYDYETHRWSYTEEAEVIRSAYHALVSGGESVSTVARGMGTRIWRGRRVAICRAGAWRGHGDVEVTEHPDGTFTTLLGGAVKVTGARSLTAAVQPLLHDAGKCESVNGYSWMGLAGRPAARPRKGRSVAILTALVQRLQVKHDKAVLRASKVKEALEIARTSLAEATTAADQPPTE